jgi:hypothetical protein
MERARVTPGTVVPTITLALNLAASFALAAPHAPAMPSPSLLPVREIMDRYVRALGGHRVIFAHRSMTVRTKLTVAAKSLILDRVIYFEDRRSREVLVLPGGDHDESGYDGAIAWTMTPKDGATLVIGDETRSRARDADMRYPARILEYFRAMADSETCAFEGRTCYHLVGVTKWGARNEHFYDVGTGLLVGYRWQGDAGEEREVFSDYRDFGGWKMPVRIEHRTAGGSLTEEVRSVTYDDVPDSLVALPPAARALLRKAR